MVASLNPCFRQVSVKMEWKFRSRSHLKGAPARSYAIHTEKRYPHVSASHHFIVSMKQAARFYSERHEREEVFVKVKLPFACEIHGFYDPIDDEDDTLTSASMHWIIQVTTL